MKILRRFLHSLSPYNLIILSSFLICGCVATQHDMLQMQSQMDDLNHNLGTMQKNQADLTVKMDNLSSNLNAFSENIKDLSTQMNRLSAKIDELENTLNRKVNAIGQTIKKQQEEVETTLLPAKIYNDAYSAFLNNNHDSAINGFKNYLSRFPQGDMVESAYFNLGEAFYIKGNWQDAAVSYANVLDKFPKSAKIPQTRLKYALSLMKLPQDKKAEALKYMESILKDFPKSAEARAAKEQINKLKEPPKAKSPTNK
ncbi:MAG: outer membrane protein assembly factor BamD [Elusimicrobia bacterium]|nr:outer membrane protein assembly factor BamD [Elusimicrobiota bacterium]